jgi:hypothetical protein
MPELDESGGSAWVGAQGERDGKAFLVRARRFPVGAVPQATHPNLLVIEVGYDALDDTGLPAKFHYDNAEVFEETVFDQLEEAGVLFFVFSEIGDGKFRYFSYVTDPEAVIGHVRSRANPKLPVEFFSGRDPEWNEYKRRVAALS